MPHGPPLRFRRSRATNRASPRWSPLCGYPKKFPQGHISPPMEHSRALRTLFGGQASLRHLFFLVDVPFLAVELYVLGESSQGACLRERGRDAVLVVPCVRTGSRDFRIWQRVLDHAPCGQGGRPGTTRARRCLPCLLPPLFRPPATTGGAVALAIVPCPALFADRFLADRTLASPSTASASSSALDVFKPRAVIFSCGLPLLPLACTRGAAAATTLSRPMLLAVRLLAAPRPPSTSTGSSEASTSFTQRLLPCARFLLPSTFVPGAVQPANLAFPERPTDRAPTCAVLRWVSAGRMEASGISSGAGVVGALPCRLCLLPALPVHSAAASAPLSSPKSLADRFRPYPAPPSTSAGAAAIRER